MNLRVGKIFRHANDDDMRLIGQSLIEVEYGIVASPRDHSVIERCCAKKKKCLDGLVRADVIELYADNEAVTLPLYQRPIEIGLV